MSNVMSPQDALIATMILMSAADRNMSDSELKEIGAIVELLPAFENYDNTRITVVSETVVDLLEQEEGLDTLLGMIAGAIPMGEGLNETAYALACDVAAADGAIKQEEIRLLEIIRHRLQVGRLSAAAIERAARARHLRISAE
ncbi:MAG: tellurite resistance TerB family protein [Pseudomonadota bacterium]